MLQTIIKACQGVSSDGRGMGRSYYTEEVIRNCHCRDRWDRNHVYLGRARVIYVEWSVVKDIGNVLKKGNVGLRGPPQVAFSRTLIKALSKIDDGIVMRVEGLAYPWGGLEIVDKIDWRLSETKETPR